MENSDKKSSFTPLVCTLSVLAIAVSLYFRSYPAPFSVIWPSIMALIFVFLFRSALLGLAIGALSGALLLSDRWFSAPVVLFDDLIIPSLQSRWNLCVLIFTLIMGGFASLIEHGGGIRTLVEKLKQGNGSPEKRLEWTTFGLGFLCFFDGLANSMLVGGSMRPAVEGIKGSKLRLAYIVDSTSSPIACIAFLSTWIAYQLSMIQEGLTQAEITGNPYSLFLQSIPFNFYCWFTLILLGFSIAKNWSFRKQQFSEKDVPSTQDTGQQPGEFLPPVSTALAPLAILGITLFSGLLISGRGASTSDSSIIEILAQADAALVLLLTSLVACIAATLLYPKQAKIRPGAAMLIGMERMLGPVLILVMAWALSASLKQLEAAGWVSTLIHQNLPVIILPALIFLCGAMISFMTGTSWGTMGILMPLAIPLAIPDGSLDPSLLISLIGAVFSGAVFGDHCSPISDTTIISSISCGVQPFDHVRTQLPFALTSGVLALSVGFLLSSLLNTPWFSLILGIGFIAWLTRKTPA